MFRLVDRLLRGELTRKDDLIAGRIPVSAGTLLIMALVLGGIYGVFMGLFGSIRPTNPSFAQLLATIAKVPLLFLLTLLVTFPSLYVFATLAGARLDVRQVLRMLLSVIAVSLAVLASLGPITGFFTLSTDSYDFMIFLNVLLFTVAGIAGIAFLRKVLGSVFSDAAPVLPASEPEDAASPVASAAEASDAETDGAGVPGSVPRRDAWPAPRPNLPGNGLRTWILIYAIVGAQMAWILRPFVGAPDRPFSLFRQRDSSFFEAFLKSLGRLFS